jgi:anti-sigma B factor antagonist
MSSLAADRPLTGDRLEICVVPRPGVDVVSVAGDFDVVSGKLVRHALRSPTSANQHVILDLSHVTFMDAHAVGEIVYCSRMLTARGADLALVCPDGPARRLLQMVGLDRVWTIHAARADALRAAAV